MKRLLILPLLCLAGCSMGKTEAISVTPQNWDLLAGKEVTIVGSAGNSQVGPIIRLDDGGYIGLTTTRPWIITAVGRDIEAKGTIVSGEGLRAEKYLLELKEFHLITPK